MANAFNKEIIRSITQSAGRFAAIAIISLLGAGFYGGLRMAAPDMRLAGDEFFDGGRLFDISVVTTLGLDDDALDMIADVEGIDEVMGTYQADAMVRAGDSSYAASIESLPLDSARASDTSDEVNALSDAQNYLNRPILLEGAWPAAGGGQLGNAKNAADGDAEVAECVVSKDAAEELGISIGDTLVIEKTTEELDDTFSITELKVSGFVNSCAYASSSMLGTTTLGTGSLDLYIYVGDEVFDDDLPYTKAYATVAGAREKQWGSAAYDEVVAAAKERVEAIAPDIAQERRQAIKDAIHEEVVGVLQEVSVRLDWADDIEEPDVYVIDRSKNPGAAQLDSDADGIAQIASVFPLMFFLVAALVSLTSMTRMVDEERMVIGTHKALGYSRGRITAKYLIYGALASGIGSVVGVVVLGKLLPLFIMVAYGISYAVPVFPVPLEFASTAKAIGLSVGVTAAATWGAAASSLREKPASLMLPRVPKAGKRIILERIKPLWTRMSFSHKVTARNLLRYKRRFFMAVVGIAGCTALLMIGFGLRDAIGGIVTNQYVELMSYDASVRVDDKIAYDDRKAVVKELSGDDVDEWLDVADFNMIAHSGGDEDDMRIEVIVPSDASRLADFVTLRNRVTGEVLAPHGDEIVLTEKAAKTLGVNAGDIVELFDENMVGDATGDARTFTVGGIAENYLNHYAYLMPEGYERVFDEEPKYTLFYVKLAGGEGARGGEGASAGSASSAGDSAGSGDVAPSDFSSRLLEMKGVNTVSYMADRVIMYEDMLDVMNKLIYLIVAAAAALAFVVLYNLTNINISERVREIATLKVLGFTRGEVNAYIFREIIIMALIGALIGCVLGVPATGNIAEAAETPQMMFGRSIEPLSFIVSFALTMVFSVFVAFTMRGKLARVNMVESLKSIE